MRFFAQCAYLGTNFSGWQIQPNDPSIQEEIEKVLSLKLQQTIPIVGCGRTDAGVHAKKSFFHFEFPTDLPLKHLDDFNHMLPDDICIQRIIPVEDERHARFDAVKRSYIYHIAYRKSPFNFGTSWYLKKSRDFDLNLLNEAAGFLLNYGEFYPFCKANTDAKTMKCDLTVAEWKKHESGLEFHITANRFLRGMVRLIVGMCTNVADSKLELSIVKEAMDNQERLEKAYSAPAKGLFLTEVQYPFID